MKRVLKQIFSASIAVVMIFGSISVTGLVSEKLPAIEFSALEAKAASAPISVAVSTSPEEIKFNFDSNSDTYINGTKTDEFTLDITIETDSEIGENEVFYTDTTVTLPDAFTFEDGEQVNTFSGYGFTSDGKNWTIPVDVFITNPLGLKGSEIKIEVYCESNLVGGATVSVASSNTQNITAYFMNTDGTYTYKTTKSADENGNVLGFTRVDDEHYARNIYTITFNIDGMTNETMSYYGASICFPEVPSKAGYCFEAWEDENGNPPPATTPPHDLNLYGKFSVKTYTTYFDTNGGLPIEGYRYNIAFGEEIPLPPSPVKSGYTFAGWDPAVPLTMPMCEGLTFTALWTVAETYTITYIVDGEVYGEQSYYAGETIKPLSCGLVKDGFVFLHWAVSFDNSIPSVMPEENITAHAVWIESTDSEEYICIYSTNPTLSTSVNGQFDLSFSLYNNGEVVSDWNEFALTVGNNDIIGVSEYKENEEGFYVTITGLEPGTTTLIVTDTDSGASNSIEIKIMATDFDIYSYRMDEVPEFYPDCFGDSHILTNFFNINGLYVSDYTYSENSSKNTYTVTFNAYNYFAHYGSVDVYDSSGKWIASDCINKATTPASLWEVGESAFYLISDTVTGKLMSYKAASFSEKSEIKIEVPDGGYFTISNNITQSPGTFIYNVVDYLMKTVKYAINFIKIESVSNEIIDKLVDKDMITGILTDKFYSMSFNVCNVALKTGYSDAAGAMATDFEDLLNSLGISWKSIFAGQLGLSEEIFTEITGPVGMSLKLCFLISDASDILRQTMNLTDSKKADYVAIHTPSEFNNSSMNEVTISDPNNSIDDESVIQVFKVLKSDEIKVNLNKTTSFDDYRIYNISIIKGGSNINPNGKVTVAIPIPEGFDGKTCSVLRQEEDGSWTILEARVEGNYLVFETDHFSLYALTGNYIENISLYTKPTKTNYDIGDVLDITGLSLLINNSNGTEEIISEGLVCSPTVLSTQGVQTISAYYGDLCCKFKVNVGLKNIKLSILTPTSRTINYGESIKLHASTSNLPSKAKIKWIVEGKGVKIKPSFSGESCTITSTSTGNVVIKAYVVDQNGNIVRDENGKMISDSEYLYSEADLWSIIMYFFKKIFGINFPIG